MNTERSNPTRAMFVTVSIVTVILLVGSAILQRVIFKADEPTATLYFSRSSQVVRPGDELGIDLLARTSLKVSLAGAQLSLTYNEDQLEFQSISDALGWRTVIQKQPASNKLVWIVAPVNSLESLLDPSAILNLGTLHFKAKTVGSSTLALDPTATLLAAAEGRLVENVLASVQDTQVVVSNTSLPTPSDSSVTDIRIKAEATVPETVFNSQRLISAESLLLPNSALVLVRLQQPAHISIRFGSTTDLTNTVSFAKITNQAAVKLSALEPNGRYYYQVVASTPATNSQLVGQVKSFQLPSVSAVTSPETDATTVDHAQLIPFPARTDSSIMTYAILYDKEGGVITGVQPTLKINNDQVSATAFGEVDGLYQAALSTGSTRKELVKVSLQLSGQELKATSALFDPALAKATDSTKLTVPILANDQRTMNTILIFIGLLLALGIGFYKLSRAR